MAGAQHMQPSKNRKKDCISTYRFVIVTANAEKLKIVQYVRAMNYAIRQKTNKSFKHKRRQQASREKNGQGRV